MYYEIGKALFQSTPPVKAATIGAVSKTMRHLFQSTPPVKAATSDLRETQSFMRISIHAAREGGDALRNFAIPTVSISIHAAREGGDVRNQQRKMLLLYFNPRRP